LWFSLKVSTVTAILYRRAKIKICLCLLHFTLNFYKTWHMRSPCNWAEVSFVITVAVKATLHLHI
jgi:hypothetical protein